MVHNLKKDICDCCRKNINIGQPITECLICNKIIHTKCYKSSNFKFANDLPYCCECYDNIDIRYNPYRRKYSNINENDYDQELIDVVDIIQNVSKNLETCMSYDTIPDLDKFLHSNNDIAKNYFSSFFLNIDGNRSNFDNFLINIHRLNYKFSVIGLAETNISPENKSLYEIDDYESFYQDLYPEKAKGTGVAVYIHKTYAATLNAALSQCSKNLESIFVNIKFGESELTVGVIYRPHLGDPTEFLNELQYILKNCPNKNLPYRA